MSEFNLATADKVELKAYAKNTYELNLSLTMGEDTMREKIVTHCKENNLEAPMAVIETKHDQAKPASKKAKKMIVNIARSDKPGGDEPVFIGVQGTGYLIPRGIDIHVSPAIVEVLKNAVTDNVKQDLETGEVLHNEVPTYPYSAMPV